MARWSGKVDANLTQIMTQPKQWASDLTVAMTALRSELTSTKAELQAQGVVQAGEITTLRNARHEADGKIAMHEGALKEIGRRLDIHGTKD